MAVRRILQLGDPVLRQPSLPVAQPSEIADVLQDLDDTLAEFRRVHGFGRGISAIQIGVAARVIFLRVGERPYELVNPEYLHRSEETFELWDDCFSFPNLMVRLRRHQAIRLRYQDRQGAWSQLDASNALSELIQHEMDHLDGILAVDRAKDCLSLATRDEFIRWQSAPQAQFRLEGTGNPVYDSGE